MLTYRDYEMPEGRTPESFKYRIEEVWEDGVTDTLYTDEPYELARIVPLMLADAYDVRVTTGGVTTEIKSEI